ncbi:DUF1653 domain-containing protein [Alcanivorax sp. 1008]|uniref:DUF1653 domain-containing protein n=1 Tax=Alcanivorax sp. 1008 TaxID=2816853 RepID=UPI001D9012B7|nr:DUF1653 domain-containing protein [Alcanivorax sp. 1008]
MTTLRPGIYKHYKGNMYQVVEVATHSETLEKVVVYRPMYGEQGLWVRPLAMFTEEVDVAGVMVPRFAWQSASPAPQAIKPPAAQAAQVQAVRRTAAPALAPVATPAATSAGNPADASVEERVKAAMSAGDDKPDFSSIPLFDNPATAIKAGLAGVAVLILLIWLF